MYTLVYLCETMRTLLLVGFIFCMCFRGTSQIEDDKALHFLGGNLYGLAGAGIAKQISDGNRWWTFAGAVGGSALIGIGKEAVDASQRENGWDNGDLIATILGGITVGLTIDLFTDHKRNEKRAQRKALKVSDTAVSQINQIWLQQSPPSLTSLTLSNSALQGIGLQ